jgi:hypothetical protein
MRFRAIPIPGLILAWLLMAGPGRTQDAQPTEYQLKAALIFNFAKFVEWPPAAFAGAASPIVIGILGDNPFDDELARTVRGKAINNRPLVVQEFRSASEATNCHVLFISNSEKKRLPEILKSLQGTRALTVGETDRFTESGGMINFFEAGKKIRFQINLDAARNAGLKVSSRLLSIASQPAR